MRNLIENGERDYHTEFFIIRKNMVVIWSKPVGWRPVLIELNNNIFTSYYSNLKFLRRPPYLVK